MGKFIIGIIVGIIIVPVAFYFYCVTGHAPVATSASPMPFERFFAKTALHATLNSEAPKTHSSKATEGELIDGVDVYQHNCAMCHGIPAHPASSVAKGEFPPPPQLFQPGQMVTDDPVGVTYWKATHGIRLTGMPGFTGSLTDSQRWDVSLLLANADRLPPDVQQALESPPQSSQKPKAHVPASPKPMHGHK